MPEADDLWGFYPDIGKGLPFWLPAGAAIRTALEDHWRAEHARLGYDVIYSPHIGLTALWERSGHLERYGDRMYPPLSIDEAEQYMLRPMNCPFHIRAYASRPRSYREFPLRFAELGTVFRKVPSGSLVAMLEDREFTQDDAHIFVRRGAQTRQELANVIDLTMHFLQDVFHLARKEIRIIRRLRPDDALGELNHWSDAQSILSDVLEDRGLTFDDVPGEGLFYGPKIDFELTDPTTRRHWICSTLQLDIVLGERFRLEYTDDDGTRRTPLIIHRTILGSLERFVGLLVARTGGHLPVWLAPIQVVVVPIAGDQFETNLQYAERARSLLLDRLKDDIRLRVVVDAEERNVEDSKKRAIASKAPYIVFVGSRELLHGSLAVTRWDGRKYVDLPEPVLIDQLADEIRSRVRSFE